MVRFACNASSQCGVFLCSFMFALVILLSVVGRGGSVRSGGMIIWCTSLLYYRYAVPFDDKDGRERIRNLFRKCRVTTLPSVVLLDESGRVVNSQAYTSMLANPQGFPWRRQKVLQMLGDSVVNQKGETIKHVGCYSRPLSVYHSC